MQELKQDISLIRENQKSEKNSDISETSFGSIQSVLNRMIAAGGKEIAFLIAELSLLCAHLEQKYSVPKSEIKEITDKAMALGKTTFELGKNKGFIEAITEEIG